MLLDFLLATFKSCPTLRVVDTGNSVRTPLYTPTLIVSRLLSLLYVEDTNNTFQVSPY